MAREIENNTPAPIDTDQQGTDGIPLACKKYRLTWWVLGAVLALLVVLGWVFIIVMLILEEKWQLVLVAWLLLYSAAHFCYWYFKRCRPRPSTTVMQVEVDGKGADCPPAYDDVMNTEAPPPAYFTVVSETTKPPSVPAHMTPPTIVETSAEMSTCEGSDVPPTYVDSVSGAVAAGGLLPSPLPTRLPATSARSPPGSSPPSIPSGRPRTLPSPPPPPPPSPSLPQPHSRRSQRQREEWRRRKRRRRSPWWRTPSEDQSSGTSAQQPSPPWT